MGGALLAGVLTPCALGATGTAVSGTVRDPDGTPQMGALIELLTPSAALIAQAITDQQGHYLLRIAKAGIYQIRASSAFLSPAMQPHLILRSGANTIADLTLAAGIQPRAVKTASSRTTEQRTDDWRWVLRSPSNRPLLRLVDQEDTSPAPLLPDTESEHAALRHLEGELQFTATSGAFGQGLSSQTFSLARVQPDSSGARLQATWSEEGGGSPEVAVQLQRVHPAGAKSRVALLVSSHESLVTNGSTGYRVLQSAATESFALGDLVQIDVGTLLTAEQLLGSHLESSPYLRVGVSPAEGLSLEYRYASDRSLQRTADLGARPAQIEVLADAAGRPVTHAGNHHELALTRVSPAVMMSLAAFHDELPAQAVQGMGALTAQDAAGQPVILDRATETFRLSAGSIRTEGVHATLSGTLHPGASGRVEAAVGRVLKGPAAGNSLAVFSGHAASREAAMVRASVHLSSARNGSGLEASYRWQPSWSLSQVDAFDAGANEAYLRVALSQRLWSGSHAERVDAALQASNLLAEGYIPVLSADGRTVYLAQVPRSVQATLAFHF